MTMVLFLISFLVLADFRLGLLAVFVLGVVKDLWIAGVLGESSLKFLILALVVNLYKSKFRAENLRYLVPFIFFALLLWHFRELRAFGGFREVLREAVWGSLLMVPVFFIFSRIWYKIERKERKIKV